MTPRIVTPRGSTLDVRPLRLIKIDQSALLLLDIEGYGPLRQRVTITGVASLGSVWVSAFWCDVVGVVICKMLVPSETLWVDPTRPFFRSAERRLWSGMHPTRHDLEAIQRHEAPLYVYSLKHASAYNMSDALFAFRTGWSRRALGSSGRWFLLCYRNYLSVSPDDAPDSYKRRG